jgi:transposase, IS5 family
VPRPAKKATEATFHEQRTFGNGLIEDKVKGLSEEWMIHADRVLEDEQLIAIVFEALGKRHPKSKSRGREGTSAETVMRLMILKRIRNWSYVTLEREVRANLVYRNFTRVGASKMPDAKTMGRWGSALGPGPIKQSHKRMVKIAQTDNVVEGRRMRIDTTLTETNVHYLTDSSLLRDGVRVSIRTMKKITKIAGDVATKLPDRSRAVKLRMLDVARAARSNRPTKAQGNLPYATRFNQSGGRTCKMSCTRGCRGRQACLRSIKAVSTRWSS